LTMKFNWEKSSRTIDVTDLPRRIDGILPVHELTLEVSYAGSSSGRTGFTLDNAVMPLLAAAPELLAALKLAAAVIRDNGLDESMAGEFEIITDAIERVDC